MRFSVETWAPDYGAPTQEGALADSADPVDAGAEISVGDWCPRSVPAGVLLPDRVRFVDGVRRVDARVWVTDDTGVTRQGICASYAAGVVACDDSARIEAAEVRRALLSPARDAVDIVTRHGRYRSAAAPSDDPDALSIELQGRMAELEKLVSDQSGRTRGGPNALLVVDGPLRQRHHLPGAVGMVKTHQRSYLPDELAPVVAALDDGQRTPLFLTAGRFGRWSWYLRLPGERTHGWAGIVRCEADRDLDLTSAVALADTTAGLLPRFASAAHKDPRAPQNLYPIAGLERELKRRLGDPALLYRSLRSAAAAAGETLGGPLAATV